MTSSFLQHKAGPGCITYDANMAILQIATQIMRDYLEQQKCQTVTAQECADMASHYLIRMGKMEFYKAMVDSLFKAAGGAIGMGLSVKCILNSNGEIKTLGKTNTSLEDLEKVRNQMEKPDPQVAAASKAPTQPKQKAPAPIADHDLHEGHASGAVEASTATVTSPDPEPIKTTVKIDGKPTPTELTADQLAKVQSGVEEWCKKDCVGPLKIELPPTEANQKITLEAENLNSLPDSTKTELRRTFQEHEKRLSHLSQKASLAVQNIQTLSQLASPLTQLLEGIGGCSSMTFALDRSRYEAAKTEIQQSQEFIKQVDGINSQGAQQAFDQTQKALQAYMSVVSANTRA